MGSHRRLTSLDAYLHAVRAFAADGRDRAQVARAVAVAVLRDRGVEPPDELRVAAGEGDEPPPLPPTELCSPWLLGQVHEALIDPRSRRRSGAHYTPADLARRLVAFARAGHGAVAPTVCDPAAGGGAFLLAAAESLAADGVDPVEVVRRRLYGGDLDPVAVDVTRASLAMWAGTWPPELDDHLVVADALRLAALPAECEDAGGFDLVVGNPPFQSQLAEGTARGRAGTDELRARFGRAAKGYVDNAALFLLVGLDLVTEGGRVSLVQPHSTLATRDAAGVRAALLERGQLVGVWFATEQLFSAGVRVWAPVIEHRPPASAPAPAPSRSVACRTGAALDPAPPVAPPTHDESWAPLVADLTGVPAVRVRQEGRIGDLATATAGFRDEYYGLVGAVHERGDAGGWDASAAARLVTSGLVDPLDIAWGDRPVRFAGQRWQRPVVHLDELEPRIARWVRSHLAPKLVVATQTKVLEVAVDEHGDVVPSTPVIAVHARQDLLWHLAAALSAPPVTALALRATIGTALAADAVKLSARQVLALALPAHQHAWDHAAALARKAALAGDFDERRDALAAYGAAACAAYGVDPDPVLSWWLDRLPRKR